MPNAIDKSVATETIRKWVTTYSDQLFSWALHKTGNREAAEDLVQDTFMAAVQSFEKFQGKSNPKTWLFGILNHKIMDYHRTRFKNATSSLDKDISALTFDEQGNWKPDQRPTEWTDDPKNFLDDPEFNVVLQKCMGKLPQGWFSAIQLKFMDEKNGEQICQELGITPTNFWQILHRAKVQLRKCLESGWFKK